MKPKVFLILSLVITSCIQNDSKEVLFTRLPSSKTHIDFVNHLEEDEDFNIIEYLYFNNGAGVAAGDVDNDGLVDLFFTSNQQENKLYLNKGNLSFEDITSKAGVSGTGNWTTGVTMADINSDGFLDIYVCHVGNYKNFQGRNQLFINQGNHTFKEQAQEYGLDFQGFSTQAAFFDYDLDGDLDMYLLNHSVHTSRSYGMSDLRFESDERAGDKLFRNDIVNGKPFFTDVTEESGIYNSQIGYGLGVNINDINNDGYPDVFVSNDFHENDYLYINQGDGTFVDQLNEMFAHTSRSSMGNDVADFNNDGLLDVIVLDMLPDNEKIRKQSGGEDDIHLFQLKLNYGYHHQFVRNTLQLNLGNGKFSEIGRLSGIYSTDWSWSPLFCDVDNDGWKDLFITNGIYRRANDLDYVKFLTGGTRYLPQKDNSNKSDRELYEKMPLYPNVNYLFKNKGDLTFSNLAEKWGFDETSYSNGSTYADLDNDGDLDLIVNNINQPAFIYRNNAETISGNHYLSVSLQGDSLNTKGIGARVNVYNGNKKQILEQFLTRGFMSSTSGILHFGLGVETNIDSVVVWWPNYKKQVLTNISVDSRITLHEKNATSILKITKEKEGLQQLFVPTRIEGLQFRHKEDSYSELFGNQLIPRSLSAEGPALAVGDVNNDGLDDLFIGGAKGQAANLFVQQNNGTFQPLEIPQLTRDRFGEDVDAAFFDADGDSDIDLYIARGGNEALVGDPFLADHLLINKGNGDFVLSTKNTFPYMAFNSSCVRPCDYDNDGDIDLFIGTRSLSGSYGLSANQYLLENNGSGTFRDVTDKLTNGHLPRGMVTDASWLDYDNDNDPDLILAGEWMNISVYKNNNGYLEEATSEVGLKNTSGWWNSIRTADIDSDGDMDIIAGNLGLNSIFKASVNEPVEMFINDFDNNGTIDPIICSYQNGVRYPIASFDEMAAQITGLKEKYPSYSDFAGQTLENIFGEESLKQSLVKKVEVLESSIFINQGDGTFEIHKLPKEVQFSPVRDILLANMGKNKKPDLILAGNDYSIRPSIGRYDAAYGWYLMTEDNIPFHYNVLMPTGSGLKIEGDVRKLCLINILGKPYLIAGINNGDIQLFRFNNE